MPTDALAHLPAPETLRRKALALATLDALISPDWQYRYHSHDPHWSDGQWMGSMRNGSGDHWFLVGIDGVGLGLKGLDHESPGFRYQAPLPGILDSVPRELSAGFTNEAAFDMQNVSFVAWFLEADDVWRLGTSGAEDGSDWLLDLLLGGVEHYRAFAADYFEVEVPAAAVELVFSLAPMTKALAESINPDLDWPSVVELMRECGYPIVD